jgi:hypothetical protein
MHLVFALGSSTNAFAQIMSTNFSTQKLNKFMSPHGKKRLTNFVTAKLTTENSGLLTIA